MEISNRIAVIALTQFSRSIHWQYCPNFVVITHGSPAEQTSAGKQLRMTIDRTGAAPAARPPYDVAGLEAQPWSTQR